MPHKWERMDFACLGRARGIIFRAGSRSRDKTPFRPRQAWTSDVTNTLPVHLASNMGSVCPRVF